jgi:hypothetical protein
VSRGRCGAPGKLGVVGDQRVARQQREVEAFVPVHRMRRGRNHAVMPRKQRFALELIDLAQQFGRHPQVDLAGTQHGHDLRRTALAQLQPHARIRLAQAQHRRRQHIAGLGMGGGQAQYGRKCRRRAIRGPPT